MLIDTPIFHAMKLAVDNAGGQSSFARECGLSRTLVQKWMSREVKAMEEDNYSKVYPHIKRWLPPDPQYRSRTALEMHDGDPEYRTTNPCADKPPELRHLCEHWHELSDDSREMILAVARQGLKKLAANAVPADPPAGTRRRAG